VPSAPDGGNYNEDDEDSNGYDNADVNKERVGHGPWKKVVPAEEVMQIPVPVEVEKMKPRHIKLAASRKPRFKYMQRARQNHGTQSGKCGISKYQTLRQVMTRP